MNLRWYERDVRGRGIALLLGLLVLTGQLAGLAHLTRVHHHVCPLDGVVVEGPGYSADAAGARGDAVDLAVARIAATHQKPHHCSVCSIARVTSLDRSVPAVAVPPSRELGVRLSGVVVRLPDGRGLYQLAPKNSPPRA